MPSHTVILEITAPLGPLFVHVPLPYDASARLQVEGELARVQHMVRESEFQRFRRKLEWLPRTEPELAQAESLWRAGLTNHDACARALGYGACGCPDCA